MRDLLKTERSAGSQVAAAASSASDARFRKFQAQLPFDKTNTP